MPLKPRIVLATLMIASVLGIYLTWAGSTVSIVVPIASWVTIVSLGTLLTNGFLWLRYIEEAEKQPRWLVRRWSQLGYAALGGTIAGLTVRLFSATNVVIASLSLIIGITIGTIVFGAAIAVGRRSNYSDIPRLLVLTIAVSAGLGLIVVAWRDVGMEGGTIGVAVVRAIHLVAVGAWIGGAVWHNTLVASALATDSSTDIKPVIRRFQRVVPLFIVAILLTGIHQTITWLGVYLSVYLTTTIGLLVGLKVLSLVLLTTLVVHGRIRNRTS